MSRLLSAAGFAAPLIAATILLGLIGSAAAEPGAIEVTAAWARATVGHIPGGAFLTIVNKGNSDDRLIAVTSPVAKTADVHQSKNEDGVMKMVPVPVLEIKAGATVTFAPGGYHIMLMGLTAPLKAGETFPLTLVFEKAGKIEVTVKVGKAGAMSGGGMEGMKMN
jgi:copper(I)-binding protein